MGKTNKSLSKNKTKNGVGGHCQEPHPPPRWGLAWDIGRLGPTSHGRGSLDQRGSAVPESSLGDAAPDRLRLGCGVDIRAAQRGRGRGVEAWLPFCGQELWCQGRGAPLQGKVKHVCLNVSKIEKGTGMFFILFSPPFCVSFVFCIIEC